MTDVEYGTISFLGNTVQGGKWLLLYVARGNVLRVCREIAGLNVLPPRNFPWAVTFEQGFF